MKRILSVFFLSVLIFTSTIMFSACSPKRAQVKFTLSNDKELIYVLYKDYAPETVKHFIDLVESGYYNGVAFSDFQSGRIMFGDYSWNDDNTDLILKDYLSVPTLEAELNNYSVTIKNNPLLHSLGTLSFYNDKYDKQQQGESGGYDTAKVKLFISTAQNSIYDKHYVIFGKLLNDKSIEVLQEILEDELTLAEDYAYSQLNETYGVTLPSNPIYIKSATVIKK